MAAFRAVKLTDGAAFAHLLRHAVEAVAAAFAKYGEFFAQRYLARGERCAGLAIAIGHRQAG